MEGFCQKAETGETDAGGKGFEARGRATKKARAR